MEFRTMLPPRGLAQRRRTAYARAMLIGTRETRRRLAVLCTLVAMLTSGCATIVSKGTRNRTSGAARGTTGLGHPYTGVRCDAVYVRGFPRAGWSIPLGIAGVVDMPFSLLEDTFFLPVDLVMSNDQPWTPDDGCGVDAR
jgi:uncharacterized protein YceK